MFFIEWGRSIWLIVAVPWITMSSLYSVDIISVIVSAIVVSLCFVCLMLQNTFQKDDFNDDDNSKNKPRFERNGNSKKKPRFERNDFGEIESTTENYNPHTASFSRILHFYKRQHLVAAFLHSVSSLVLSVLVYVEDSSWKAPLSKTISSWVPVNASNSSSTPNATCSDSVCYISVKNELLDLQLPLIDLVVLAACVSASFHLALYVFNPHSARSVSKRVGESEKKVTWKDQVNSGEWQNEPILGYTEMPYSAASSYNSNSNSSYNGASTPSFFSHTASESDSYHKETTSNENVLAHYAVIARWNDYSISASAIVAVLASLCGIVDIFTILLISIILFYLLDSTKYMSTSYHSNRSKNTISKWETGDILFVYNPLFDNDIFPSNACYHKMNPNACKNGDESSRSCISNCMSSRSCSSKSPWLRKNYSSSGSCLSTFTSKSGSEWWPFIIASSVYLLAWSPIIYTFGSAWEEEPTPPDFVIVAVVALFSLYSCFLFAYIRKWDWGYIALSFITKTTLHWLLYSGTVNRKDRVFQTEELASKSVEGVPDVPIEDTILAATIPTAVGIIITLIFYKMKP